MSNSVTIQFNDEEKLVVSIGEETYVSVEKILALAIADESLDSNMVERFTTQMAEVENNELKLLVNNSPKPSYAEIVSGGAFIGFASKTKLGNY